jgi:PHP family Zn ribbon phosphoesterase
MLYGLNPALGKYYLTRCADCGAEALGRETKCSLCGGRVVRGVKQRIEDIADCPEGGFIRQKPGYRYHFPLSALPGIGAKVLQKVYCGNLTAIDIMYKSDAMQVEKLLGKRISAVIEQAAKQKVSICGGGAGRYGYVIIEKT